MEANMKNKMADALKELQAADFTAIDLMLYLDTHPDDMQAQMKYNSQVQKASMMRYNFENEFKYPLTPMSASMCLTDFCWIDSPWPWDRIGE